MSRIGSLTQRRVPLQSLRTPLPALLGPDSHSVVPGGSRRAQRSRQACLVMSGAPLRSSAPRHSPSEVTWPAVPEMSHILDVLDWVFPASSNVPPLRVSRVWEVGLKLRQFQLAFLALGPLS